MTVPGRTPRVTDRADVRPATARRVGGRWWAVGVAAVVLVAIAVSARDRLWRTAYPHLPRAVQAAPYVVASRLLPDRGHVALPTAGAGGGGSPAQAAGPSTAPDSRPAAPSGPRPAAAFGPRGAAASGPRPAAPSGSGVGGPPLAASADPPVLVAPTTAAPTLPPPPTPVLPPRVELIVPRHQYQTWNNCGPATVAMALGVLGDDTDQAAAALRLKPEPNDKNVGPDELARFARERGFGALVRLDGSVPMLRALLAAGLPVVVETWFVPEPGDEMGHYLLLTGYRDQDRVLIAQDSYHGPGREIGYDELDALWRVFGRLIVLPYPLEREAVVRALLGDHADQGAMYGALVATAESEIAATEDAFGWFALGTGLLGLGDAAGAASAYDRARALGLPWRMLWYQHGPFEAYAAVGRWADVRALADANLANVPDLEESLYWRGRALEATGDPALARAAYQRATELNPLFEAPRERLALLP